MQLLTSTDILEADSSIGFNTVDENERASLVETNVRDTAIEAIRNRASAPIVNPNPGVCMLKGCGEDIPVELLTKFGEEYVRFCSVDCCRRYERMMR